MVCVCAHFNVFIQGCPILLLEDQRPAEFSFNLPQHTCPNLLVILIKS